MITPVTCSSNTEASAQTAVQVALRVRPLTQQDKAQPRFSNSNDSDVIKAFENSVVVVPHQKSFQFDHVFDPSSTQEDIFLGVGSKLVDRFMDGYNVTILAYGQTSSGKTYTMGTALDNQKDSNSDQEGIIPRAMAALFERLEKNQAPVKTANNSPGLKRIPSLLSTTASTGFVSRISKQPSFNTKLRPISAAPQRNSSLPSTSSDLSQSKKVARYTIHVSFIEIYNEELIDLLNPAPAQEKSPVTIREDAKGQIIWTGLKEIPVKNAGDVLRHLQLGTENRATGSTDMNAKSSRSHAIFSVTLKQEKWVPSDKTTVEASGAARVRQRQNSLNVKAMIGQMERRNSKTEEEQGEWMVTHSKFHFVDLAGSERLKRTAAEGDRRKEGININAGLSALGNVICALSDPHKRSVHVPYRDSKLTRLLQDSLGGNSTTLMIACVSPAETNLTETINTLKYAYRARSIRNKSEKNEIEEWMTNDNVDQLRQLITKLKSEIKTLKSTSRSTPSPHSSGSRSSKSKPTGYLCSQTASTSTSSLSITNDSDLCLSSNPSATTQSTMLESMLSTDVCQDQDSSSETTALVLDLRRQVEELQNELSVTRERNLHVEKELSQSNKRQKDGTASPEEFQHLVEPVIEEYEKSISSLESQLAMARAALTHSDKELSEQQAKITEYMQIQSNESQTIHELKSRLSATLEREQSSEAYCIELETQLQKAIQEGNRDQKVLSELREKIIKFKEMDSQTEKYISDLEARLSSSESERTKLKAEMASIAAKKEEELSSTQAQQQKESIEQKLILTEAKCQELESELLAMKEHMQSQESEHAKNTLKIDELSSLLSQKESEMNALQSKIKEIGQFEDELAHLRQTHLAEIERLEEALSDLKKTHQAELLEQKHQEQIKIDNLMQVKYSLEQQIQDKEELDIKKDEIEKLQRAVDALSSIEEKQTVIIQELESKIQETDCLLETLYAQLRERDSRIKFLEDENLSKETAATDLQVHLRNVLGDVEALSIEKEELEKVMQVMEKTLRLQENKNAKAMESLEEIKRLYKHHQQELVEKTSTIDMLNIEKRELSELLQHVSQRASESDSTVRSLTIQLDEARRSTSPSDSQIDVKLEEQNNSHQIQKYLAENQALKDTVSHLEHQIKHERNLASTKDSSGMIQELESRLFMLQEAKVEQENAWRQKTEKIENELFLSLKESKHYKAVIDALESSLEHTKKQIKRQDSTGRLSSSASLNCSSTSLLCDSKQGNVAKNLDVASCDSLDQQELVVRIIQLQEDNNQLIRINEDIESQLTLQRSQSTLEARNLELELMKLSAVNDRLEKEMEQVAPQRSKSISGLNRESIQFTSPPQTPRISSPPLSFSQSSGNLMHYKMQREISSPSITRLSKSSSLRSVSLLDNNHYVANDDSKRVSYASIKSDAAGNPRGSLVTRYSKTHFGSGVLPPPTAPPCNPLPPIPSSLPAVPSSVLSVNETLNQEGEGGPSVSRPTSIETLNYHTLRRQDSIASSTFSEVMSASSITSLDSEKYDKIIRSLQRKAQTAENDVKAHQDVISKLEAQLLRSESSVLEAKKQLSKLSQEKQAYDLEINSLRSQVNQIQSQQMTLSQESVQERKELEEKLEQQKELKEKAEKARRILENRMDELMNRKSKFMCF